ncbi:6800_t:CDS:10 [Diversispora eburnea]|uniref:6800_t:CDS:1 n=1 Tax=Diversispora eburnea TaxID=1213867 RepID=A0A9N8ZJ54_9GLOM|nr:6800_t:CDS:10 [Diversispora eburnea]
MTFSVIPNITFKTHTYLIDLIDPPFILGKNEILASLSSKVDKIEYIKRDTTDVCSSLNFSDVLSDNTKIFGFYDPLKPLENNYSVVEFIKDTRINYLNYIVDINILYSSETDRTIQQELNDLRNNSDLKVNIIKNDCDDDSLDLVKGSIDRMHNSEWNESLITTFTVNVNDKETPSLLNNSNSSNTVTFNSLFKELNGVNFTKLIWGFDLSGIMKTNPGSITGLIKNDDTCLNNDNFYIWPWKEIRKTALTDMCIAKNNGDWIRYFDSDTNSTILSNLQLDVSFAYEDPESLYYKFKWVTDNKFAGISIANLTFDSINDSVLKFIKSVNNENKNNGSTGDNSTTDGDDKHNSPIVEKNEIFASSYSKVYKVEYIKRDTPNDNDIISIVSALLTSIYLGSQGLYFIDSLFNPKERYLGIPILDNILNYLVAIFLESINDPTSLLFNHCGTPLFIVVLYTYAIEASIPSVSGLITQYLLFATCSQFIAVSFAPMLAMVFWKRKSQEISPETAEVNIIEGYKQVAYYYLILFGISVYSWIYFWVHASDNNFLYLKSLITQFFNGESAHGSNLLFADLFFMGIHMIYWVYLVEGAKFTSRFGTLLWNCVVLSPGGAIALYNYERYLMKSSQK